MLHADAHLLTSYNTLGLHAVAHALARYSDPAQLPHLSNLASQHSSVFVLGGGSNVVLNDRIGGLVIKVEARGIRLLEATDTHWIIEAHAGENWHDFVQTCLAQGWFGLENLALIPGTVGAAPVQNIGAYGLELDQRFHSLSAWDLRNGRMVEMASTDCGFAYRDSIFKRSEPGRWLIVAVRFRLPRDWSPLLDYPDLRAHERLRAGAVTPQAVFEAVCDIRRRKLPDPAVLGNAGSFFKNPIVSTDHYLKLREQYPQLVAYPHGDEAYKLAAGWLIDRCGWKGRRLGTAGVHDRQALVLVNHGDSTAADIRRIADAIKSDVYEQFGVQLEQEPVSVA